VKLKGGTCPERGRRVLFIPGGIEGPSLIIKKAGQILQIVSFILISSFVFLPFRALAWFDETNGSASVVVGQPDFESNGNNQGAGNNNAAPNTLSSPSRVFTVGTKLFIVEQNNNRILVFNSIPTSNNASGNYAVGQVDLNSGSERPPAGLPTDRNFWRPFGAATDGQRLIGNSSSNGRALIWNSVPTTFDIGANIALGQSDFVTLTINEGGRSAASLSHNNAVFTDGTRLFLSDYGNHRVLIWNTFPTAMKQPADIVVGQPDFATGTANTGGIGPNTLNSPWDVHYDGEHLFIADRFNHRVLIYNSLPISNNTSVDIVIGQADFVSNLPNQNGDPGANTLNGPVGVYSDGQRLFISDMGNNRVLVYNSIPTVNNASADIVIGQTNFTSNSPNQGGDPGANTLKNPFGIFSDGRRLFIADYGNHRVLIFNELFPSTLSLFLNLPNEKRPVNLDEEQTITAPSYTIQVKPMSKGLTKVEFYVDNNLICTNNNPDSNGVFSCDWDTTKYHSTIKIIAYYTSGKTATLTRNVAVSGVETNLENMTILPETGADLFEHFYEFFRHFNLFF